MAETFDCIVLGVGGYGSGALYHLAKRGLKVLGLEQFGVAHDRGSSHGESRIIRKAYIEHPDYVPLVTTAYEMWDELEAESSRDLFRRTGLIVVGRPDSEAITGTRLAAELHHLPIETVELSEAGRRFAGFRFPDASAAMYDPDAGYLEVELCVETHVDCAMARGAVCRMGEAAKGWSSDGRQIRVQTSRGEYRAASLVVTAGPWTREVLADLSIPLSVVRKPVFWHRVDSRDYDLSAGAPTFYFEREGGVFYGFPSIDGETIKVAQHSGGKPVGNPLTLDREVQLEDTEPVAQFLAECLPGVCPRPQRHSVCMYTLTPDHHFIIDKHPHYDNVVIGGGFSGHGFKFTTVLGEALADLAAEGHTEHPIEFLSIRRAALASR